MRSLHAQIAFLSAVVLVSGGLATAQGDHEKHPQGHLPEDARVRLEKSGTLVHYDLADNPNPPYLNGDFDGDGRPDYAISVINKTTKKHGIAIIRSSMAAVDVLGAGGTKLRVGSGPDAYLLEDFDWMDEWHVQSKATASKELGRKVAALMRGDGIVVEKSESASGLVYWDGKRWLWRQMGD